MPAVWVDSASPSFQCRHLSVHADEATVVLETMERMRTGLTRLFPRTVSDLTIVLHDRPASLIASNPLLALAWAGTAPAARRYLTGWVGQDEIHVLAPSVLAKRASGVPGSAAMLEAAPASLYTRRVLIESNHELHRASPAHRMALGLRWAWLFEGASRYFGGETAHARAAITRRLYEGGRPRFPPTLRDATLLGGTVVDLMVQELGEIPAAQFASRVHRDGPKAALVKAFGGRALDHTAGAWRAHLTKLAAAQ